MQSYPLAAAELELLEFEIELADKTGLQYPRQIADKHALLQQQFELLKQTSRNLLPELDGQPDASKSWTNYRKLITRQKLAEDHLCLLYTSPSPRDQRGSRMPSSA